MSVDFEKGKVKRNEEEKKELVEKFRLYPLFPRLNNHNLLSFFLSRNCCVENYDRLIRRTLNDISVRTFPTAQYKA